LLRQLLKSGDSMHMSDSKKSLHKTIICNTISWYCHPMGQRDEILGNIYNALTCI